MVTQHPTQYTQPPKRGFWVWLIFWLLFAVIVWTIGGALTDMYKLSQYFDVDPISQAFALHKIELICQSIAKHVIGLAILFITFAAFSWYQIFRPNE